MNPTTLKIILLFGLISVLDQVSAGGNIYLAVEVLSYSNPTGQDNSGQCCDGNGAGCVQDQCDTRLTFCLASNPGDTSKGCSSTDYTRKSLGPFSNMNSASAVTPKPGQLNPMIFQVNDWTPEPVVLKATIGDDDTGGVEPELVDTARISFNPTYIAANQNLLLWTSMNVDGERAFTQTSMVVQVSAWCADNYYGAQCQTFCVESDTCDGHTVCDPTTGQEQCAPGWEGADCNTPGSSAPACAAWDDSLGPDLIGAWTGTLDCGGSKVSLTTVFHPSPDGSVLQAYVSAQNGSVSGYYLGTASLINNAVSITPNTGGGEGLPGGAFGLGLTLNPGAGTMVADGVITTTCSVDLVITPTGGVSDICFNGGTCVPGPDYPTCCCPDGYDGLFCERSVNPCLPNPCGPNGDCQPDGFDFICNCKTGFHGDMCEYTGSDITCDDNPCQSDSCAQPVPDAEYQYRCPNCDQNQPPTCDITVVPAPCSEFYYGPNCDIFCRPEESCLGHYTCGTNGEKICTGGWTDVINSCTIKTVNGADPDCTSLSVSGCDGYCSKESDECCCKPGYAGPTCETLIPYCNSNPCMYGGTCTDMEGGYTCLCEPGFTGSDCEVPPLTTEGPTVPSTSEPDGVTAGPPGVTSGPGECTEDQDDCLGHYKCKKGEKKCNTGYTGDLCIERDFPGSNDPECPSGGSGCSNGGNCWNKQCCCPPGYTGPICASEIDECVSDPCQNGGTCNDKIGYYECTCPDGYGGDDCEYMTCTSDVDDCTGHYDCEEGLRSCHANWLEPACDQKDTLKANDGGCPDNNLGCLYGGTCWDGVCCCAPDRTGTNCEIEIDPCSSDPCENGGTCQQDPIDIWLYVCTCTDDFIGLNCETENVECPDEVDDPCLNGGTCYGATAYNLYCDCPDNYSGEFCETGPCTGDANTCEDGHYTCDNGQRKCDEYWTGETCNIRDFPYDESNLNVTDPECDPNIGFRWYCANGGTCFAHGCCCPPYVSGTYCEVLDPVCGLNNEPCLNGGDCETVDFDLESGTPYSYKCICAAGWEGDVCEVPVCSGDMDTCEAGHYDCVDGVRECLEGWKGNFCDEPKSTGVANSECPDLVLDVCVEGGCSQGECCCVDGYSGEYCEMDDNACDSNPCLPGSTCTDGSDGDQFFCSCAEGYMGRLCDIENTLCPVVENNICQNGGRCYGDPAQGVWLCDCSAEYFGRLCEELVATCLKDRDDDYGHYTCDDITGLRVCMDDWEGDLCNQHVATTDCPEPFKSECLNGGKCGMMDNPTDPNTPIPSCYCSDEYEGGFCEFRKSICTTKFPCKNGGICSDTMDAPHFKCECPDGISGDTCENGVATTSVAPPGPIEGQDPCNQGSNPESYHYVSCEGNYKCVYADANGDGLRQCLPGWKGTACREPTEFRPTECPDPSQTCKNGGFCLSSACCCPANWGGMLCDTSKQACVPTPCNNGGTCNEDSSVFVGYTCTCPAGFSGENCQLSIGGSTTTALPPQTTEAPEEKDIIDIISSIVGSVAGLEGEELEQFVAYALLTLLNLQDAGALANAAVTESASQAGFEILNLRTEEFRGSDGKLYSKIYFQVKYTDANGNVLVLDQDQLNLDQTALDLLLNEYLGNDITEDDLPSENVTTTFSIANQLSFSVFGTHLDDIMKVNVTLALRNAFVASNAALDIDEFKIECPRVDEIIADNGSPASLFYYWLVNDGTEVAVADVTLPTNAEFEQQVKAITGVELEVYTGDISRVIQESFGIYFEGNVFDGDLGTIQGLLQTQFEEKNAGILSAGFQLKLTGREQYFRSTGSGAEFSVEPRTRLFFFLTTADGDLISPTNPLLSVPNATEYQSVLNFTGADGNRYSVDTDADTDDSDFNTKSSLEFLRIKESFSIYVEQRVAQESFMDFQTVLQEEFRKEEGFASVNCYVVAYEEVFVIATSQKVIKLDYFMEMDGAVLDGRRKLSVAPALETMVTALGNITAPSGETYMFVTDESITLPDKPTISNLFPMIIEGTVVEQDYQQMEAVILASVLETNAILQTNYDSVSVKIISQEEMFTAEGASVTTVYYGVITEKDGYMEPVDASASIQTIVSAQTFEANIDFTRTDGSSFVFQESSTYSSLARLIDTSSVFVSTKIMVEDLVTFQTQITALVESKVTMSGSVSVNVITQEECLSMTGESVWRLMYSVTAGGRVVIPEAITISTEAEITSTIQVTTVTGALYSVVTDVSIINRLERITELFTFSMSTAISVTNIDVFKADLVTQIKADITELSTQTVEVEIIAQFEQITVETTSSVFAVYYRVTSGSATVSARTTACLTVAALETVVTSITNPQGVAYELVSVTVEEQVALVRTTAVNQFVLSETIVTADITIVATSIRESMFAVYQAASASVTLEMMEVTIIRQSECFNMERETVWVVDYTLTIGGQVVLPAVVPTAQINLADVFVSISASVSITYNVQINVDVTTLLDINVGFKVVLEQELLVTDVAAFTLAIQETYTASVAVGQTVNVVIYNIEEVIDVTTQVSFFQVIYQVTVDAQILDARWDVVITATDLNTQLVALNVVSIRGAYVCVVTEISIVRISQAFSFTLEGEISTLDVELMGSVITSILVDIDISFDVSVTLVVPQVYFSAEGAIYTTLRIFIESTTTVFIPGFVAPIAEVQITTAMATFSFTLTYTYVDITVIEVYREEYLVSFTLTQAIAETDIVAVQNQFIALIGGRAEFTGITVGVKIFAIRECYGMTGELVYSVNFAIFSETTFVSALTVSVITEVDISTTLNLVTITGTSVTYGSVIFIGSVDTIVAFTNLGFFTFTQKVEVSQFVEFAAVIKAEMVKVDASYASFDITVIRCEAYIFNGQIAYRLFYTISNAGVAIKVINVQIVSTTAISVAIQQTTLVSITGASFSIFTADINVVGFRKVELFGAIALRVRITVSNQAEFELAIREVYIEALRVIYGATFTADIQVSLVFQQEIIDLTGTSSFLMFVCITRNGVVVNSQISVSLDVNVIVQRLTALGITITGTEKTIVNAVVTDFIGLVGGVDVGFITLAECFSFSLRERIDVSVIVDIEIQMAAYLKTTLGLTGNVAVKIWKQEWVEINGVMVNRIHFSATVGGVLIDTATVNIDMEVLVEFLISASVQQITAAQFEITGATQAELALAARVELNSKFCTANVLGDADQDTLIAITLAAIAEMDPGIDMSQVTVDPKNIEQFLTTDGETINCFSYQVTQNGVQIKMDLDFTAIQAVLVVGNFRTALNERIVITLETDVIAFYNVEMAYTLHFTCKIRFADQGAIIAAVQTGWATKRTDLTNIEVVFIRNMETYSLIGESVIEFTYVVRADGVVLDAQNVFGLTDAEVNTALAGISITGAAGDYLSCLWPGHAETLISREELCFLVVEQKVTTTHMATLETTIASVWETVDASLTGISISTVAQEEVFVDNTYIAFQILYKAEVAGNMLTCRNYDQDFITAISTQLTVTTIQGVRYSFINVQNSLVVQVNVAYELWMTKKISFADTILVQTELQAAWLSSLAADVTIAISYQQDYINTAGEMLTKVMFTATGVTVLDAQVDAGLAVSDILNALLNVGIAGNLFTDDASAYFNYVHRFTLDLNCEINTDQFAAFQTGISQVWQAEKTTLLNIDVLLARQESVVDTNGIISNQLVYFVTNDDVVLDSRVEMPIDVSVFTAKVATLALSGPKCSYEVISGLVAPVRRLELSTTLLVRGSVPAIHIELFRVLLEQIWRETAADVCVHIVTQEEYVHEGVIATGLVYYLEINGVVILPACLGVLDMAKVETYITFKNQMNLAYTFITDISTAVSYKMGFSIYVKHVIRSGDLAQLTINLGVAWRQTITTATTITIVNIIQEQMVSVTREVFWKLTYFVEADGVIINPNIDADLVTGVLQTAMDITIAGGTVTYTEVLATQAEIATLVRVSDLFFMVLVQKASPFVYVQLEQALVAALVTKSSEDFTGVTVTVMTQTQYISDLGEFVWGVSYKVERNGMIMKSQMYDILTHADLSAAITIPSPSGGVYAVYNMIDRVLLKYESAFFVHITQPVLTVDRAAIDQKLVDYWKAARTELVDVSVTFARQEETLDAGGMSVYKYLYFVESTTGLFDAVFEGIPEAAVFTAAFEVTVSGTTERYSSFLYAGDLTQLVSFDILIGIPLVQKMAVADYLQVEGIIRQSWIALDGVTDVTISIKAQEEYISGDGQIISMVLYSASVDGVFLGLADLPELPPNALDAIEAITGPTGETYTIAKVDITELRRYKMAMQVYVDKWVSRQDKDRVMAAVLELMKEKDADVAALLLDLGAQEQLVIDNGEKIYSMVIFASLGTNILDATLEVPLLAAEINAKLVSSGVVSYTIIDRAVGRAARNLRHSFAVYVNGFVAEADLAQFDIVLDTKWAEVDAAYTAEVALMEESVGVGGVVLTGVRYFLLKGDAVVDPLTITAPELTTDIPSAAGESYVLYRDAVVSYEMLFSVTMVGEMSEDEAEDVLAIAKEEWSKMMVEPEISVKLIKLELAFGSLGTMVTNVMYTVEVRQMMTFPANDPAPNAETLAEAVKEAVALVDVYAEDVPPIRTDKQFHVTLEGVATKEFKAVLETAITASWETTTVTTPVVTITGMEEAFDADKQLVSLSKIYYTVESDGEMVSVVDSPLPSNTIFDGRLKAEAGFPLYPLPVVRLQHLLINGELKSQSETSRLETAIAEAWSLKLGVGNVVSKVFSDIQVKYATSSWIPVNKVQFTVLVDDEDLRVKPDTDELDDRLEARGFTACGCRAKRTRKLYLTESLTDLRNRATEVTDALLNAWSNKNLDIARGRFRVVSDLTQSRKKRALHSNSTFKDDNGDELTPVQYQVSVDNLEPNTLFVSAPSDDDVKDALDAAGLDTCGCDPKKCSSMVFKGTVADDEMSSLEQEIAAAYLLANTDLLEGDIAVQVTNIDTDLVDGEDNPLSEVFFCIQRLDDGDISDLIDPTKDQVEEATGRDMMEDGDQPFIKQGGGDSSWVIIMIGICCGCAFLIVFLAVVKVLYRRCQSSGGSQTTESDLIKRVSDIEDYAGHGPVATTNVYATVGKDTVGYYPTLVGYEGQANVSFRY